MNAADTTDTLTTVTLDPKTGKPPKSRIVSAYAVYSICNRYRDDDMVRAKQRGLIERQIDGFKPYSDAWLKQTNQQDISNVPFRTAESNLNIIGSTYANLIFDVSCLVDIYVKDNKLADRDHGPVIAEKFHDLLMRWSGFVDEMDCKQKQMLKFGPAMVYFPHERTFKFRSLQAGQFLVDSAAPSSIDRLTDLVIRSEFTPTELFWKIMATDDELERGITDVDKQKIAAEQGWNIEFTKQLIIRSNMGDTKVYNDQYNNSQWESAIQQIKNGDTYATERMGKIRVDNLFIQEFRGGVSWYMIPEDWPSADSSQRKPIESKDWQNIGFLYESPNVYKSMLQVGSLFFLDVGDGTFHSVKGYGTKNYSHNVLIDRMKNKTVDAIDMKNAIVVQGEMSQVRKARLGRITILPTNVQVVTNAFQPDIQAAIEVTQFLEQSLDKNSGIHSPDLTGGASTAKGERIQLLKEGKVERKDIMRYYLYLDKLYTEMLRRVLDKHQTKYDPDYEEIQQFKQECIDAGVPSALLDFKALQIRATRAVGFGSPVQARETYNELLSLAAHLPEVGSTNAVHDAVANLMGHWNVRRYAPEDKSAQDPSNQTSFAVLENSTMEAGGKVAVGKDQMHVAHLSVHFDPLMQLAQQFISTGGVGDNPLKAHDFFAADMAHIAQHMDVIKDDPTRKPEYDKFMQQFDELQKIYGALDKMARELQQKMQAEREQQMQQAQQQPDAEMQLKMAKMQQDGQLAAMKEQNMNEQRTIKTSHAIGAKDAVLAQKLKLEAVKAQAEISKM